MVDCRRLLGLSRPWHLAGWWLVLTSQVAALRLVYPVVVVLVERAWAGSALLLAALSLGLSAVRGATSDRVTREVRTRLFDALTSSIERYPALAPPAAPSIEELESQIAKGVPWVEALATVTLPGIVGNAIALPVIAWLSWVRVGARATLIAGGAMVCGALVGALAARQVSKFGSVAWESYQPVAQLIESGFRGRVELGIHQRSGVHRAHLLAAVGRWSRAERRLFVWGALAGRVVPAATALSALALAALAGEQPVRLLQQLLGSPSRSVVAASLLAITALPVIFSLARGAADWSTEWPHVEALARFVDLSGKSKQAMPEARSEKTTLGAIRLEDVRFEYPGRRAGQPRAVVEGNVVWQSGETLAISGPNGSGKTTLTWLLMGIIEPDSGRIAVEIDGALHSTSALAGRIAYLPQQPYFEEQQSVDEAIRFVAPNASDREIEQLVAALLAEHCAGDVRSLLDRAVMSLSVGERRVIALARALLRNSELVILDEPEANLDGRLRQRAMSVLREAKLRSRLLIVTHDEAFAGIADRVYQMPPSAFEQTA